MEIYKKIFGEFAEDVEFLNDVVKGLDLDKRSKILDVGTGFGTMSTLLALNGYNVVTGEPEDTGHHDGGHHEQGHHDHEHHQHEHLDLGNVEEGEDYPFENMQEWSVSAEQLNVRQKIEYQHFDVRNLPFSPNSFDGIFLYDALQHIPEADRKASIMQCLHVLAKGGVIVVFEWTQEQIQKDLKDHGFLLELVDPRTFMADCDEKISIEMKSSAITNAFIIKAL